MSFVGNIDPGGTVVLVHLENWRNFVPILLVRPRVMLPNVLRILAVTDSNVLTCFRSVVSIKSVANSYSVQALFHRRHEFAAVTASISSGEGGGIPV